MSGYRVTELVLIAGGAYLVLSAYGWLPGRPKDPKHPLVKQAKILGIIVLLLGMLKLLLHNAS